MQVNNVLNSQMVQVERKSWSSEQYSRRECLEVVGIPESVTVGSLEETALNILKDLGISGHLGQWSMSSCRTTDRKKVIVKMSRQCGGKKIP